MIFQGLPLEELRIKTKKEMDKSEMLNQLRGSNSRQALEEIYTYFPKVCNYILANQGTEDEAKDVFQESVVILYEKAQAPSFELSSNANTYVFSVCKNIWYAKLRAKGKVTVSSHLQDDYFKQEEDQSTDKEEQYNQLDVIIDQLGEKCKSVLHRFYFLKQGMAEIADKLGYSSVNTAKTQKYKCLERAEKMAAQIKSETL